jgi:hypothetical protein
MQLSLIPFYRQTLRLKNSFHIAILHCIISYIIFKQSEDQKISKVDETWHIISHIIFWESQNFSKEENSSQ